jgi:transposase
MSLRKIGEELGLARNTVRKYFRQPPDPPLPTPRPLRASQLDRYEDYLLARWSQGERNAAQLHREISERGYPGSASMVRAYVGHLRTTTADGAPPRSRKERAQAISPRALRWLLARKRDDLDQKEQAKLDQLLNLSPEVQTVYALLHAFLNRMPPLVIVSTCCSVGVRAVLCASRPGRVLAHVWVSVWGHGP